VGEAFTEVADVLSRTTRPATISSIPATLSTASSSERFEPKVDPDHVRLTADSHPASAIYEGRLILLWGSRWTDSPVGLDRECYPETACVP
jgi:hypothetical protein